MNFCGPTYDKCSEMGKNHLGDDMNSCNATTIAATSVQGSSNIETGSVAIAVNSIDDDELSEWSTPPIKKKNENFATP